jgi:hypothetical protein
VTGPAWLAACLAGLMLLVAASCAGRLAIWQLRGRGTEPQVDSLHVLMGVAMAGMLAPQLSQFPDTAWRVVFAVSAAWFGWQAIRARGGRLSGRPACTHPVPHAVECAAMLYMLLPARPAVRWPAMGMPGMSGLAAAGNPALALVLALFMVGYILWTTDQLASLSRARAAEPGREPTSGALRAPDPAASTAHAGLASRSPLAPRFAACYKIAMSVAMGYMLVAMI